VKTVELEAKDFEGLNRTLSELKEDERVKIVEGIKDKRALEYFGIKNIRMLHGNSLAKLTSSIKQDAILLVDFDRTGKIIAKRLADLLKNESIHVDLNYRRDLRKYAKISEIEELVVKYRQLLEKFGGNGNGKDLHRHGKIRGLRSLRDRWSGGEARRGGSSIWSD
jgi:5S rRNA maturation endonuclease (ribonuclease M5)